MILTLRQNPWYHEPKGPEFFNAWTIAHAAWGAVAARYVNSLPRGGAGRFPFVAALVLHTVYELAEQDIFPLKDRDVSTENHIGDTLGFSAGYLAARRLL